MLLGGTVKPGMAKTLRAFTAELRDMMVRTGTSDLAHMDPTMIHLA